MADTSIALGYRSPKIMSAAEREQEMLTLKALRQQGEQYDRQESINNELAKLSDLNDLEAVAGVYQRSGMPDKASDLIDRAQKRKLAQQEFAASQETAKLNRAKQLTEGIKQSSNRIAVNPTFENAAYVLKNYGSMYGVDVADDIAYLQDKDPETIRQWALGHAMDADKLLPKFEKIDIGGSIQMAAIDPLTGKPTITASYDKTATPDQIADNRLKAANSAFNPDGTPNKAVQGYEMNKSRAGASSVSVGFPKETFKNERDLRNDFQGLPTTKAFREVQTAYDQITTALKNPSAANDLAAATKFMKLLDPGSVVRESELAMAMEATGKLDQFMNYANRIKTGEKLTPSQRKDFANAASALYSAASGRYNESADEYRAMAQDYQLNPDRIAKKTNETVNPKQQNNQPATVNNGWSITKVK